ncbi:hypothetical protein VTO58DRAFT_103272 [Aureobasidium pullulans]
MQDIDNLGIDKRGLYIRFKHEASMRKYCGLNLVQTDRNFAIITAEGFRRLTYCVDSDGKVLSDWVTMNDDVLRKTTNVWLRNNQPIDAAALNKPNSFAVRRKDPSSPVLATPTHAPRGSTSNATSSRRDYSPRPYSSSTGPYRRYTPPLPTPNFGAAYAAPTGPTPPTPPTAAPNTCG